MKQAIQKSSMLAVIVLVLVGCSSFNQLEPVHTQRMVVIYQLDDASYPENDSSIRDEVPSPSAFPELSAERWQAILGNLYFKRENLWSDTTGPIYAESELPRLCRSIVEATPLLKAGHRMVLVSRYDPDRSVLSRMRLNTALIWVDETGLNIVFGVIHEELPVDEFHTDEEWAKILPISLKQSYRDLQVLPEEFFSYKEIQKLPHKTWVVMPIENLEKMEFESREKKDKKGDADSKNKNETEQPGPAKKRTPAERLRSLQKALDEGLITEEEYQIERERILKEF